ncbi:MAG: aldo/keto reductase [Alphaproteobacteria bacterium]|nr:aldo/keto reductase [Alphaproteobacteria bacterium]MCB9930872.1 aldo/keto reductase [Alphaproteobacteria bacterium]
MEFRNLGRSGLRVSAVGLGCNNFGMKLDEAGTRSVVHAAIDAGITLFDTADMYGGRGGSETHIGAVLGTKRKDIVLASKFGMDMDDSGRKRGGSRRYIMSAVEDSLRRLRTDWLDLYQLHQPDPLTPIDETLRALDDLVRAGKVRYVGCSNLPAWQMVEAHFAAELANVGGFVSAQEEYNMLNRAIEKDVLPVARRYGFGLLPYFPLASGLLTGKYKRNAMPEGARLTTTPKFANRTYVTDANWAKVEKLDAFASERGHSLLELAFAWLLAEPATASVIAGATKPEQVAGNVAAAGWSLSAEDKAAVDAILA